jgi:serine phosphatase RsbU (regulator of sigma subunit)
MTKSPIDFKKVGEQDFKKFANKYHLIAAWVAIILNPIWGIIDYFNSPDNFVNFTIFRLAISVIILITVFYKKKFVRCPEMIGLVPFLGIAIQNAYMLSVMNLTEMHNHTFAHIALFIGAGMFILWDTIFSIIVVSVSLVANIVLFSINSDLSFNEVLMNGGLLTTSVALFSIVLIYTRTNLTRKTIYAQLALAESNLELEIKNELIEEKSKDINDSINYAQRIQQAIFPPLSKIEESLKDYFILFHPKDIVSGDFYWFSKLNTTPSDSKPSEEIIVLAAVDCTGHGVPGALMSIIGSAILNQSTTEPKVNSPAEALTYLDKQLSSNLHSINDGMDIAFCAINQTTLRLQYAGANNPIYIIRNNELIEIKSDKKAIGGINEIGQDKVFTNHSFQLEKNDCIYLFTDGYADQFGGEKGKKLKYKAFQELLVESSDFSMQEQQQKLQDFFENWKGKLDQIDDVLVIGIRI